MVVGVVEVAAVAAELEAVIVKKRRQSRWGRLLWWQQ